jgi:HEAT repeat protein
MPIDHLIADLTAPDASKRAQAAEQLAQLGSDAQPAAVALVRATGDDGEEVRQWAASALEEMGPPSVSDLNQLAALIEDHSSDVGYWATTLLGRLKAEAAPAVNALARAVGGQQAIAVPQRAAWPLGEIGPAAVAALPTLKQVASDPDPRLARLAQQAISQIAGS